MKMATKLYQLYSWRAEVVHVIWPEQIAAYVCHLAMKPHIVRNVAQYNIHRNR